MKSCIALPLEQLADAVQRFTKRPDARLLHVAADDDLRSGALRILLAAEHLASNHAPWAVLDDASAEPGWARLEQALVRDHGKKRDAGVPLAPLDSQVSGVDAARFAARLCQYGASVQPPAEGLVLLLSCRAPELSLTWLQHLTKMIFDPVLDGVRFVLLGTRCPTTAAWSEHLTPTRCMVQVCAVDPAAAQQQLQQEIDAEAEHGPGQGKAWPPDAEVPADEGGELPPLPPGPPPARRVPAPPDPPVETVSLCAKRAALAMQRSDGVEATRQQARARDLCIAEQRPEDAVRMELVLGGYLLELGETKQAQGSFARAAEMAQGAQAHELEAQARYAEAWTWRQLKQVEATLRAYWEGIDAAKRGDAPRLVFDGYWDAGGILRALERLSAVVSLWSDAISYANTLEPARRKGTRLPEIARELSAVLREMRRTADARAVDVWAQQAIEGDDATVPTT